MVYKFAPFLWNFKNNQVKNSINLIALEKKGVDRGLERDL